MEYIFKIPIFVYSRHGTDKLGMVVFQEISKIGIYSHFTARGNVKIGINFSKIGIKIGIFDKTVRVCKHKNRYIKNFFLLYFTHPISILRYTYFYLYTAICK